MFISKLCFTQTTLMILYAELYYDITMNQFYHSFCKVSGHCRIFRTSSVNFARQFTDTTVCFVYLQDPIDVASSLCEKLCIPEHFRRSIVNDQCCVCNTHVQQLKLDAINMVQSVERAHTQPDGQSGSTTTNTGSNSRHPGRNNAHQSASLNR